MISFFKKNPELKQLKENLQTLQLTFNKAKRDLQTGIKEDELELMYNQKYILEKDYLEIKNSIQSLKLIVELYPTLIEQTNEKIKLLKRKK